MTVIATASNPRFSVSRVDIDRPGETYTIDTLRDLRAERGPDAEFFFITGADALAKMISWRDADELFKLAHFVGCTRPGHQLSLTGLPAGADQPHRDPGAGHLLHRVPRPGPGRRPDLVPRARRDRAVHQQAPAVPGLSRRLVRRTPRRRDEAARSGMRLD